MIYYFRIVSSLRIKNLLTLKKLQTKSKLFLHFNIRVSVKKESWMKTIKTFCSKGKTSQFSRLFLRQLPKHNYDWITMGKAPEFRTFRFPNLENFVFNLDSTTFKSFHATSQTSDSFNRAAPTYFAILWNNPISEIPFSGGWSPE